MFVLVFLVRYGKMGKNPVVIFRDLDSSNRRPVMRGDVSSLREANRGRILETRPFKHELKWYKLQTLLDKLNDCTPQRFLWIAKSTTNQYCPEKMEIKVAKRPKKNNDMSSNFEGSQYPPLMIHKFHHAAFLTWGKVPGSIPRPPYLAPGQPRSGALTGRLDFGVARNTVRMEANLN